MKAVWRRTLLVGALAGFATTGLGCAQLLEQIRTAQARFGKAGFVAVEEEEPGSKAPAVPGGAGVKSNALRSATDIAKDADGFRDAGAFERAYELYREALILEPTNAYAQTGIAVTYTLNGRKILYARIGADGKSAVSELEKKRAGKMFQRAIGRGNNALGTSPMYAPAHLTIAAALDGLGESEKALERLNLVEKNKIIPQNQTSAFYAWKGYLLKLLGQDDASKEALQKAWDADDNPRYAQYADCVLNPEDYKGREVECNLGL
jgi:tetratricopeptide (TPR) repeat protein